MITENSKISNSFPWIFLVLLLVSSFYFRFQSLLQTEFANGWDSYFYIIQLQSYFETGKMHSSDLSFIYPLMFAVQYSVGDYELAFKLTACLLTSTLVLLSYFVGWKWTNKQGFALLLASFFAFSPHLTYFASQYPKNLLGFICFLLLLVVFPKQSSESGKTLNRIAKYALFFTVLILNYFGHRMTFVLCIALIATIFALWKFPKKIIASFCILIILLIGVGAVFPGLLNFADLERFEGFLNPNMQFSPHSFVLSFGNARISTAWKFEIIFASIAFFLSLAYNILILFELHNGQKKAKNNSLKNLTISLTTVSALLIFPFLTWSLDGIAYRSFLIFVMLAPITFFLNLSHFLSEFATSLSLKSQKVAVFFLVGLFATFSYLSKTGYNPKMHDPPYALYQKVSERTIANLGADNNLELLICHKSLAEYFTFSTGIDALPWLPEYEIDPNKLWRVATDIPSSEIQQYFTQSNQKEAKSIRKLSVDYWLVREDVWQDFLAKLSNDGKAETLRQLHTWKNPNEIRPTYLLKSKEK